MATSHLFFLFWWAGRGFACISLKGAGYGANFKRHSRSIIHKIRHACYSVYCIGCCWLCVQTDRLNAGFFSVNRWVLSKLFRNFSLFVILCLFRPHPTPYPCSIPPPTAFKVLALHAWVVFSCKISQWSRKVSNIRIREMGGLARLLATADLRVRIQTSLKYTKYTT